MAKTALDLLAERVEKNPVLKRAIENERKVFQLQRLRADLDLKFGRFDCNTSLLEVINVLKDSLDTILEVLCKDLE